MMIKAVITEKSEACVHNVLPEGLLLLYNHLKNSVLSRASALANILVAFAT